MAIVSLVSLLRRAALIACALTLASGCALYKPEIRQGNVVTSEQVAQLRKGMTRNQVQAAMGAPLLMSAFHADRWDYVFRVSKGNDVMESRKFVVRFSGDTVSEFGGDPQPTELEAVTGKKAS
ncbi:MAG: outer membrane protein assembly factor BamE [Burkholderiaceae bacterium]